MTGMTDEDSSSSSTTGAEAETETTIGDGDSTTGGCEDLDGDGWTTCDGDCCDAEGAECVGDTSLVNPGAFDVLGNMLDDDCDGIADNPMPSCDMGIASDSQNPLDYARAIDLCRFTEESPADPLDRRWGVLDARLTLTDGNTIPHLEGHSVRPDFGPSMVPPNSSSFAVLSSGVAADGSDTAPDFISPQNGVNFMTGIGVPAPTDWLAANNNTFPNPLGCAAPWSNEAHDAQMLTVRVRVPTNAKSFSVGMNFLSAEYPEWVCSAFNDFFVTLIDSESTSNPADKNIAVYDDGATLWPVGVNLVEATQGLFTMCENGTTGCRGDIQSDYMGCTSEAPLVGSGFDLQDTICPQTSNGFNGGGTGWLAMSGNVVGGEIMTLRLAVWDSSGHIYDSTVLLDDWQWSVDAAQPGIYIP